MRRDFALPDLGEGLTEGEVIKWLVAEGDTVTLNQPIVEVETAKAAVELPSPFAGTVVSLHAKEGDVVEVGTTLISFETGTAQPSAPASASASAPASGNGAAEDAPAKGAAAADASAAVGPAEAAAATPEPAEPAEDPERQATLVGPGPRATELRRRRRQVARPAAAVEPAAAPAAPTGRPKATPPVRKFARDRGVDLALITGTGKDGRVTRADVEEALAAQAEPAARPAAAARPARERTEERIEVRGTRRAIAAQMVASYSTIPHVTEFLTVDATELLALRDKLRALPAAADVKVTPLAIVAKALCAAVRDFPLMNAAYLEGDGGAPDEIVVKGWVNLGIATDTEGGLVVPTIKDADTLGILDLAREVGRLAELARTRKAAPADLTGGTITITNVGGFGVEAGTPIINKPECAIVAAGSIAPRPWVVGGALAVRSLMTVSVSFDHRIVDGAYAARFLSHLRDLLEQPVLLAAF